MNAMKATPITVPMAAAVPGERPLCAEGLVGLEGEDVGADAEVAGLRVGDEEPVALEEAIVVVAEAVEVVDALLEALKYVSAQLSPHLLVTNRANTVVPPTENKALLIAPMDVKDQPTC